MAADTPPASPSRLAIRTRLQPGDIGSVVHLHGTIYARECGFDHTFEAYVAGPLAEFARSSASRERIWLAEDGDRLVGSIAIVAAGPDTAQLRWYLVDPDHRGAGLGRTLLDEAVAFSRASGYRSVFLWTVAALRTAAHLYRSVGFRKVEEIPGRRWGMEVIEERYELTLE